jgi:hypothetical protein
MDWVTELLNHVELPCHNFPFLTSLHDRSTNHQRNKSKFKHITCPPQKNLRDKRKKGKERKEERKWVRKCPVRPYGSSRPLPILSIRSSPLSSPQRSPPSLHFPLLQHPRPRTRRRHLPVHHHSPRTSRSRLKFRQRAMVTSPKRHSNGSTRFHGHRHEM